MYMCHIRGFSVFLIRIFIIIPIIIIIVVIVHCIPTLPHGLRHHRCHIRLGKQPSQPTSLFGSRRSLADLWAFGLFES